MYCIGVCVVVCLFICVSCEEVKYSSALPFLSNKGLSVTPVKISSADGEPLLAFYMVGSSLEPKIQVHMDSDFTASFQYSFVCKNVNVSFILDVSTEKSRVMVRGQNRFPLTCTNAKERYLYPTTTVPRDNVKNRTSSAGQKVYVTEGEVSVKLRSDIIGYGVINIRLLEAVDQAKAKLLKSSLTDPTPSQTTSSSLTNTSFEYAGDDVPYITYTVTIVRKIRPVDTIFRLVVYCVQIFVAIGFGAKLDLKVVKECLVKPIAPAIGLVSQFILMPIVSIIQ